KKSLETILYSTAGVVAMALILVAVNVITGAVRQRVDLTKEKAYTLSDGTRAILAKLDTPVKIRFYCSQTAATTPETVFLKSYARKVEDLLVEYRQAGKGKIVLEKYDPQPDSDAEDSARLDGVEGVPIQSGERFYLGLAVSLLDSKEAIPFLAPNEERLLEYKISRCLSRVMQPDKPVVGVMSPMPVFGMPSNPMMMQMGQRGQEPWALITELQNDFAVRRVEMTTDKIDDEIKVLLVIHPKEITDAAQYAIDQFILRGGKLIAFLDATSLVDSQQQNPMMGRMPGGGSSLEKLLKAWGVQFENSKVVADMTYKMDVGGGGEPSSERPTWLALTPEGIHTNDIITSQIDNVWYFSGGSFSGTPVAGLKETVLLKSTTDSQLVDGFMANLSGESVMKDFKPSGKEYALAIRLTGKFKTAFPDGKPAEKKDEDQKEGDKKEEKADEKKPDNSLKESKEDSAIILVGDSDMIYDNFTIRKMQSPFGTMAMAMNGNLSLAQNAVEQLSGDNNLIAVRSRATLNRPFTVVKKMQAEAEARFRGKVKELEDSLADTQRRLTELQQNKEKGQRFILSPEQQAELEKFQKTEAQMRRDLKKVQKDLRREIDSLETRIKWFNIAAVPLAVMLCGIILAAYKRKLT
ncbi:MAG: Gldg family protein, partial [Verrucomicrobiota bacterium]